MTNQEAIAYLRPLADNTPLAGYGQALSTAIKAMETVEELKRELEDERYRHDRYVDYSRGQDQVIDDLRAQLKKSTTVNQHGENCTHIDNCGTLIMNL